MPQQQSQQQSQQGAAQGREGGGRRRGKRKEEGAKAKAEPSNGGEEKELDTLRSGNEQTVNCRMVLLDKVTLLFCSFRIGGGGPGNSR